MVNNGRGVTEDDYRAVYLDPLLRDKLGYPVEDPDYVRRNVTYSVYPDRQCRADYVFYICGRPVLVIEAKVSEENFKYGYKEGEFNAKNFGSSIVPFLIVAAGSRIEMFVAVPSNITGREFVRLPRILTWPELINEEPIMKIKEIFEEETAKFDEIKKREEELAQARRDEVNRKRRNSKLVITIISIVLVLTIIVLCNFVCNQFSSGGPETTTESGKGTRAEDSGYIEVRVSWGLPLRENPDPKSKIIRKLEKGERFRIIDKEGDWRQVSNDKENGWVRVELNGEGLATEYYKY